MESTANEVITIEATVDLPVQKVWDVFTTPAHITQWNHASDDWHCPTAVNDLRAGGEFSFRMEAKDGSFGFDFAGVYDSVKPNELIAYTLGDGRKVVIVFDGDGESTLVTEAFEIESVHPAELQRGGWQAILNNFKEYAESVD